MAERKTYFLERTCLICLAPLADDERDVDGEFHKRCVISGKVKKHKYFAKRTVYNGVLYDSKAEAIRAQELTLLAHCGDICGWDRQILVQLWRREEDSYRVDFRVFGVGSDVWYEEVKGKETDRWKYVRKLWERNGPRKLIVLTRKGNGWKREVIVPEKMTQ